MKSEDRVFEFGFSLQVGSDVVARTVTNYMLYLHFERIVKNILSINLYIFFFIGL